MDKIIKIWTFLSGKKTVIGSICYALADIATALGYGEGAIILKRIGEFFVGLGLTHKVGKAING